MTFDVEKRKVRLYIVAGLTTVNSGWNFNGYANGEMTIAVPLDWTVEIRFGTRDANYPHSVGIVEIENEMPASGDEAKIAFPRAFSLQFVRGFFGPREDKFDFKANRVGRFWLFCGVPPHSRGGMWDYFVVSEEITEPYVDVPEKEP
jgi:sulfocyanin